MTTPLHDAVKTKDIALIARLVAEGADVNAGDSWGSTPLHEAARHNSITATEILLELGADPEARSKGAETPLHVLSINFGQAQIAARLIDFGADVNAADDDGRTALHLLTTGRFNLDLTNCLLEAEEIDLEARNKLGLTPLHRACMSGKIHLARALIKAGADVDARDPGGRTPLYWAAKRENIAMHPLLAEMSPPDSAPPKPAAEPDSSSAPSM